MEDLWEYREFTGDNVKECINTALKEYSVKINELEYKVVSSDKNSLSRIKARPKFDCKHYEERLRESIIMWAKNCSYRVKLTGHEMRISSKTTYLRDIILNETKKYPWIITRVQGGSDICVVLYPNVDREVTKYLWTDFIALRTPVGYVKISLDKIQNGLEVVVNEYFNGEYALSFVNCLPYMDKKDEIAYFFAGLMYYYGWSDAYRQSNKRNALACFWYSAYYGFEDAQKMIEYINAQV